MSTAISIPSSPLSAEGMEDSAPNTTAADRLVLEYLRARGHTSAERALVDSLGSLSPDDKGKQPQNTSISTEEMVKQIAVYAQKPSRPGENVFREGSTVLQELTAMGNSPEIQSLIASMGAVGTEEIMTNDPMDKQEGFRQLEMWVDGSLDMYRPEFRPILFPVFVHFYLDLIQVGFKDSAIHFFRTYGGSLSTLHNTTLHHLSTLLLPAHIQNDDVAQRFRKEKYVVRMSRSGFSLLLAWLTEGVGGEAMGQGEGFNGDRGNKGRAAVLRIVNNHLRFDVSSSGSTSVPLHAWEESTGLLTSLIPQANGALGPLTDPNAFNASKGSLILGPAPMQEDLKAEMERALQQAAVTDPEAQHDVFNSRTIVPPGMSVPTEADMLPRPPSFKTIDVRREVEKIRDARKRIRLDPVAMYGVDLDAPENAAARAKALPSICAYTLHDVAEGAPCATFSQDTTLMAAGFAESYIRLWSLNGEKLRGLRSDFQSNAIRDSTSLSKIREKGGSTTRKFIGHSGPVYSVQFDPLSGSAGPPKYLLSASADATARLWSLDTYTNVVAYRGHQTPVWDVKWSPMGVYFATAGQDQTARLWSTDRTSCLRLYTGHLSDVDCLQFHPNSLYLATGSSDRTARLWDVQRGACVRVFIGHQGGVSTVAISPDGRYLASAGEDLAINLWDLGSGRRIKKMLGHTASIYSLAFSAESSMLVSGGADWTVRCWDIKSSGGLPPKARENGITPRAEESYETTDLMSTFPTKRTPIVNVQFTPRNLCLVAGTSLA